MNPTASRLTVLMGTASLLTMAGALSAHAQNQQVAEAQTAQADTQEAPEQVLITGSLIHGAAAVGVQVTNLKTMDFAATGAVKIADIFRNYPGAIVFPGPVSTLSAGHLERETRVNLRGLDAMGPRALLMIDGMRFPPQADGICSIDPSIIPVLALDHIDVLADGASAVYGSDAISGVINLILRRNFDGAITQTGYSRTTAGGNHFLASQLWGRTWDGGDITLTYEWYDDTPVSGKTHSNYTLDYSPWGLDDRRPLGSSMPGTISTGAPAPTTGPYPGNLGTNCTNCYAIPVGSGHNFDSAANNGLGPLLPGTGGTPSWAILSAAANSGVNGTRNIFDPLDIGWEVAAVQRNAAVMTVDQQLTKDISFFGSAFYSNRRVEQLVPPIEPPDMNNSLASFAVPTWNPYYPSGAPTNLRVGYSMGFESPGFADAYEVSLRYQGGLNIDLPAGWQGQIYYSESSDANHLYSSGAINKNAVSASLGWTIAASAAVGSTPGVAAWTKPANVPYLNLFCDASRYICNSRTTIDYMTGIRISDEKMSDNEKGVRFDGPLFDLPGGTVRAAIGATYTSVQVNFLFSDNANAPSLVAPSVSDAEPYQVWATFTQLNIPIFGDANAIPLFRRLDFEASWRHDQYTGTISRIPNGVNGTSNPKLGFTWELSEDAGLNVRGAWGTSFRFANAGEYSPISVGVSEWNLPSALGTNTTTISVTCVGGSPIAGSAGAKLFAAGFGCNTTPNGLGMNGSPATPLRIVDVGGIPTKLNGGLTVKPEQATNWSAGFELAPTAFVKGLDIQATYYIIKINGVLTSFGNPSSTEFNSPADKFHFIVPSDLPGCAGMDATPQLCAPFQTMVSAILFNPNNTVASPAAQPLIYWLNDGGTVNAGWRRVDGIDWSIGYDWEMANVGGFNTGIVGTYYLHDTVLNLPGSPTTDRYHQDLSPSGRLAQNGVEVLPRFRYRARLGWSNGPWTVTGFMDYQSHYFHTLGAPPNVNFQCTSAGGTVGGGTFQCAIHNYSNIEPPWYSFDLSFGYDTGDDPVNNYLKHTGVNFVVQDIMDKHAAFQYGPSNSGRTVAAFDVLKPNQGRTLSLLVTKTW